MDVNLPQDKIIFDHTLIFEIMRGYFPRSLDFFKGHYNGLLE